MEPVKVIFGGAEREPQGYTRCRVGGGCHSVAAGTGAERRYEIRRSLRRPFTLESEHRVYEPSKWATGWARQVGHPGIGQKRIKRCCWKPPANRWSYASSWACRNRLMSIFAICSIASTTRFAFAGSLSPNSSPSAVGTICQDTPNLSFSQPHLRFLPAGGECLPQPIDLFLRFATHGQRDGLRKLEVRATVRRHQFLASMGEVFTAAHRAHHHSCFTILDTRLV